MMAFRFWKLFGVASNIHRGSVVSRTNQIIEGTRFNLDGILVTIPDYRLNMFEGDNVVINFGKGDRFPDTDLVYPFYYTNNPRGISTFLTKGMEAITQEQFPNMKPFDREGIFLREFQAWLAK